MRNLLHKSAIAVLTLFVVCAGGNKAFAQPAESGLYAPQQMEEYRDISPRNAMLRSFVLPGWGHHYANPEDWRKGQYYMAIDVALITSLALLVVNSGLLEDNMYTLARAHSGTDIESRSREFQLAVGNHNSLSEYNAQNERTFNWHRMMDNTSENYWQWDSQQKRQEYQDVRDRWNMVNRQIPTVAGLMVLNRIVGGLSSFITARNELENIPEVSFNYMPSNDGNLHPVASLRLNF